MKARITPLLAMVILCSTVTAVRAESEPAGERPFMGVLIDPAPLPPLLGKHLGLPLGQGLRIQNVQKDSPADKAGLERDDLIIGFEGQEVHDYQRFINAIRKAGSGTEVSLQIIHLGVRKTVKLTLRPFRGEPEWKYPPEPEAVESWRPGRFFRLRPGDEDWTEIFRDRVPPDIDVDIKRFFDEVRSYHHSNGEDYTITIEGDPNDEDSTITVEAGGQKYKATIGEIDKLPEKYREAVQDALEDARKAPRARRFDRRYEVQPWRTLPDWRGYFDRLNPRDYGPLPRFDRGEEMLDKIQKQMNELRKRLEEQEERSRERFEKLEKYFDRLSPKPDEKGAEAPEESVEPTAADEKKA